MNKDKVYSLSLTDEKIIELKNNGKVNTDSSLPTKSIKRIFYDNIATLFNILNIILFLLLILVGSYKNLLFMLVVTSNIVIGIFQEIRSKKSVDKLSILVSKKVKAVRNKQEVDVPIEELVLGDIIYLSRGSQVPSDCVVIDGSVYANESLLTGESDTIIKNENAQLYSGSFISSGECYAKINRVGADNYASKINSEAKYLKKVNSEIMNSLKKIIKICSLVIIPIGITLFSTKYFLFKLPIQDAVVSTVGALIGMIPEGLMLLTSSVLAVSVIRLSQSKVLVQELYCIETLARVDVLCLDKTGTITCDEMEVNGVHTFIDDMLEIKLALGTISNSSQDDNSTIRSIKEYSKDCNSEKVKKFIHFSSDRKWSGVVLENGTSYIIGASEFIFKDKEKYKNVFDIINSITEPVRILSLAKVDGEITTETILENPQPLALIFIKDKIRSNAKETIGYFIEQGVQLKVISGDGVNTVSNIAKEAGIQGAEQAVDATTLTTDEMVAEAAEKYNVFGRVTPQQKKVLVKALQKNGHTVAMTGDGVNDVLALKEADCSVAMAAGSEAARNVSQLVLVNNDFSSMPKVVAEGRRTINNIQRSASLFLVKTIYSMVLALIFIFISSAYPFQPIQLSFVGALTIGLPSFVLALQPNHDRIKGDFFANVISRAIPGGINIVLNVVLVTFVGVFFGIKASSVSTIAVYITALVGILMVIRLSIPFNTIRIALLIVIVIGLLGIFILPPFRILLSLETLTFNEGVFTLVLAFTSVLIFNLLYNFFSGYVVKKVINKKSKNV